MSKEHPIFKDEIMKYRKKKLDDLWNAIEKIYDPIVDDFCNKMNKSKAVKKKNK